MRHLPDALKRPPTKIDKSRTRPDFDITLHLETITPVIGGGVDKGEPDVIDIIRVPSIRGALRWWWRTLFASDDAEETFQREAKIWGGVGVEKGNGESGNGKGVDALKSSVVVEVTLKSPGKAIPAGGHDPRPGGRGHRAFPRWSIGRDLAYALFPLQLTRDELRAHGPGTAPTRSIRKGVKFKLRVRSRRSGVEGRPKPSDSPTLDPNVQREVLATLWAFAHLGGIGARTRRGFGALAAQTIEIEASDGVDSEWKSRFQTKSATSFARTLKQIIGLGTNRSPESAKSAPTVDRVLVAKKAKRLDGAHGSLVKWLEKFRQGTDVGRRRGKSGAGKSNWPEADVIRREIDGGAVRNTRNPIPMKFDDTPRAALGLPIEFQFKGATLKASLLPTTVGDDSKRWASPLILRPVLISEDKAVPVVVALTPRPDKAGFSFSDVSDKSLGVDEEPTTGYPINELLAGERKNGRKNDACDAFVKWLRNEEEFEVIDVGETS